jgi:amino acid adenylation domain-containing protein/non-ribosomal peptide synthase protein (TIGR01720 family)
MMPKKQISCYMIGEDKLIIQCAEILLVKKHKILGIFSSNSSVQTWAAQQKLPCFASFSKLKTSAKSCDYLFSIVNYQILPEWLLTLPNYFAINYHDSLLPRYAGIHATSWAILNGEKEHGVSWHVMTKTIDAGDILKQGIVQVSQDETALSLNLKCYNSAIQTFSELVDELAQKTYTRVAQDLTLRSYYGRDMRPPANGLIHWEQSAEDIDKLCRALYFGPTTNRLATAKISWARELFVVDICHISEQQSNQPPGTVVAITAEQLQIATQTNDLILSKIRALDNTSYSIEEFFTQYKLKLGDKLESWVNGKRQACEEEARRYSSFERFWVNELGRFKWLQFPFLPSIKSSSLSSNYTDFSDFSLLKNPLPQLTKKFKKANVLLTLWLVYLYRLGNQESLSIGYRKLNENRDNSFLVSYQVPCSINFTDEMDFSLCLKEVNSKVLELSSKKSYCKDLLGRYPELSNTPNYFTLSIVIVEEMSHYSVDELNALVIVIEKSQNTFHLFVNQSAINPNLLTFLRNVPEHLLAIVDAIIAQPKQSIAQFDLVSKRERRQILGYWNQTKRDFPHNKTVHQLFEEQVTKTPDNIAVIFKNKSLTYAELNQKSNQLAHYLLKQGVKAETIIGLCFERDLQMVIGLLGILKAGGAYLAIDPNYPDERIQYMLADCQIKLCLTHKPVVNRLQNLSHYTQTVALDEDWAKISGESQNNLTHLVKPNHLIYILYTSGSTGKPKGVLVEHLGVVNCLTAIAAKIQIDAKDKFLALTSLSFDVAALDYYLPLSLGASVVIASEEDKREGGHLLNLLLQHHITIMQATPSAWQILLLAGWQGHRNFKLLSAGEALTNSLAKRLKKCGHLFNIYGPTETTIYATLSSIKANKPITIGKPISNVNAYVLSNNRLIQPIGVIGELYISGAGLARGYLNQPENMHAFNNELIIGNRKIRAYKTGDLVRWQPDGNLEYLGRRDEQVKIRGFRIELGEIESVLMKHSSIHQAVVCVRVVDEHKQLEAFFTRKKRNKHKNTDRLDKLLAEYLRKILPDYMVPVCFHEVENFPLNFSGKIDKKGLLDCCYRKPLSMSQAVKEPSSDTEINLLEVWKKVLKIDSINSNDNFFTLGGDSISAMQIVAAASHLSLKFTVKDIFQFPTILELAKHVKKRSVITHASVTLGQKFPLTPIQNWFFKQELRNKEQFSQACLLTVNLPINIQFLEECLQIIARQDTLNLRFKYDNPTWQQFYTKYQTEQIVKIIDSSAYKHNLAKLITQWNYQLQEELNLEKGPLMKVAILSGHSQKSAKLLIVIHHLIIDGVSWRILLKELQVLYQELSLSKLVKERINQGSSYQNWAMALHRYADLSTLNSEKTLWMAMDKCTLLPIDHQRGPNLEKYAKSLQIELNAKETTQLIQLITKLGGAKLHEILIALLVKVLLTWSNNQGIVIELESHGREEFSNKLDLAKTLGWFTSLYPVYFDNIPESDWQTIEIVKRQLQKIPHYGIGYGLLKYLAQLPFANQDQVIFNYWGQFDHIFTEDNFKLDELKLISHPENQRIHLLNVDALVKDKKLKLIWTYSTNYHKSRTIKQLAKNYSDKLRSLLAYSDKIKALPLADSQFKKSAVRCVDHEQHELAKIETSYSLSPLQKGLLFHANSSSISGSYIIQLVWKNPGNFNLDLPCLKQAWLSLIERHAVLRTYFVWESLDEPLQVIQESVSLPWIVYDWTINNSNLSEQERLDHFLRADRQAGFDLGKAPLLRVIAIQLSKHQYIIITTLHHILLDGWSLPILFNELDLFYQAIKTQQQPMLQSIVPYSTYVAWQQKQDLASAEKFWRTYLKGFTTPTEFIIPHEYNKQAQKKLQVDFAVDELVLTPRFSECIKQFCQKEQLTLNTFFQGMWGLILNRYSQTDDVLFGVTLTTRSSEINNANQIIGLLINTIPLRINLMKDSSVRDFLIQVQKNFLQIAHYHDTPLSEIQKWSHLVDGIPLFNTLFVFENYPVVEHKNQLIKFENIQIIEPTHYPLTCLVIPNKKTGQITIRLAYDGGCIAAKNIKSLLDHLHTLLMGLVKDPQHSIHSLNILTPSEYRQIVVEWNKTIINYPNPCTVHQLFEEQVAKTPDNIALIFGEQQLTYNAVNQQANQLAHYLCKQGACENRLIAICLKRSLAMVISILAVLKAGAAYVPIDPEFPEERVYALLSDSNPLLIISHSLLAYKFRRVIDKKKVVFIDRPNDIDKEPTNNRLASKNLTDPIYVIYTSGSTGIPKGVINTHLGLTNRLRWAQATYLLTKNDCILQKTPFTFDVSFWECLWPLIAGARLLIAKPDGHKESAYLKEIIIKQQVTTIHFVPSMLEEFLKQPKLAQCISLKRVICSGEALTYSIREKFYQKLPKVKLYNLYGPTEASIDVTAYDCSKELGQKIISIGKPIANVQIYILDHYLNPVPIGIKGELHIGGVALAKGYLNQQALTEEKFIPNPFNHFLSKKLYKTCDLARWLPDGNIEYLGRNDDQIKLRGFRIELGEVEQHLLKYPGISQAAVVIRNQKANKQLVAYLVLKEKQPLDREKLRLFLRETLLSYMIPAIFVPIDRLPLTFNGKIDRKALETRKLPSSVLQNHIPYVAPQTEKEQRLAQIWSEILTIPKIGINDNFFACGGHSLLVLQVLSKINEEFGINLSVRALLDAPTIAELLVLIDAKKREQLVFNSASLINKSQDKYNCLIALQSNGNKFPLFLIHPVGGTVFWYTSIPNYLSADQPVYAIQDPGLETEDIPFQNMEEMASYYIQVIRSIQPEGPYLLGGASAGGNISVEMAYQLKKMGYQVVFVGLFDAWVPYPNTLLHQEFFEANMRRQYNVMHEKFLARGILRPETLLRLQWYRLQMYAQYQTPRIDFNCTLFKAADTISIYQSVEDQFNHWEYYSTHPIERYFVPGDHETMFQEPNIAILGLKLKECIDKIEVLQQRETTLVS